ncbi:hypothetical protein DCAR_0728061 [Daucus carota subsp. sativus]|uniref:Replication protein A 70 kDa DNA-binding subunit B/D first OB fold domain-containing protein n=1 Tax=Daucus carota subsp. sativus TaxID=79200 RepID=A0AAF1B988_DAUCS|nr:hypothetical protein DCAR_0728061 [Daucus carota subsp. sativus]
MEMKLYDPISDIDSTTYDWVCRVRVQSFWKGLNRETKEFWGINMVIIDDSNSRIHAFTSAKYCDEVLKKIKEGAIYIVSNIKVKEYLGSEKFRAVRNKKHVFFTPHTKFELDETMGLKIEKFAFDLFHFDEIEKLANDERFLIDMVGKVKNIQELIKTTKNEEEKTRLKFDISNGRSTVPVTLFDTFGEDVEKEFLKRDINNILIIICCAKVGRYEGVPHLSNYPATRVYINPEHYSVHELKKSWTESTKVPEKMHVETEEHKVDTPKKNFTIKEITSEPGKLFEGPVWCEVTVKRINDKSNWYFRKCTGCELELDCVNEKFKCSRPNGCGRIIPYPDKRFRICTLCSDSTGSISIIFSDYEITRLIGKTVTDLHAEFADEAEEEKFPNILNSIVKAKYTIQLYMGEENIKNGSTVFEAKEIKQAQEKADNFDPNVAAADEIEELSMINATEGDSNLNHTPNTENSTNTKFRARKITEVVTFNAADTTIAKPPKIIKLEKLGDCQERIKVRVIRLWRGATRAGVEFKNFNLILMDDKSKRVHAFVPTKCADEIEDKITVGKTYVIKNFAVQLYSATEKFRLLRNDRQLVFSMETNIQEVDDDGLSMGQEAFDFYDHSQLEELSKQTTYLTGIIKKHQHLRDIRNKHGQDQRQAKLIITDGRLANPDFAKNALGTEIKKPMEQHTIQIIFTLGKEYIEASVFSHVKIVGFDENMNWGYNACTDCGRETKMENPCPVCESCNRFVPYPDKKFRVHVFAKDHSGQMQVVLGDREVRTVIGFRARELFAQATTTTCNTEGIPAINLSSNMQVVLRDGEVRTITGSRASDLADEEKIHTNMDEIPYQMISNLRPQTTTAWRLKVRVTRVWQAIDWQGNTVGINLIFVDELGGRIHAWIAAANMNQFQNLITEGQTYNVHNFVVRQYGSMQTYRCFQNDVFIQLYHLTNLFVAEGVDYIQRHVFHFTDLSAIMHVARERNFLIDVVGIVQQVQPLSTYRNKYNELKYSIQLTINDMHTSAQVIFYDEMAQSFDQEVHNAGQHPVIVIIASVKATLIQGEEKLTNYPPTRFFINLNHEAVQDLRDAFRLANRRLH